LSRLKVCCSIGTDIFYFFYSLLFWSRPACINGAFSLLNSEERKSPRYSLPSLLSFLLDSKFWARIRSLRCVASPACSGAGSSLLFGPKHVAPPPCFGAGSSSLSTPKLVASSARVVVFLLRAAPVWFPSARRRGCSCCKSQTPSDKKLQLSPIWLRIGYLHSGGR